MTSYDEKLRQAKELLGEKYVLHPANRATRGKRSKPSNSVAKTIAAERRRLRAEEKLI
jgi:hypothetical protein